MQSGYTGCLRAVEWGSSFDGADIGAPAQFLSGKSEALARKCDMEWESKARFWNEKYFVYNILMKKSAAPCACFICVMRGVHDSDRTVCKQMK
jgi:hypothetical protein